MGKVVKGFIIGACICIVVGIAFFVGAAMAGGISGAKSAVEDGLVIGVSSDDFEDGKAATEHKVSLADMKKPNLELELGAGEFEIIESNTSDIVVKSSRKINVNKKGNTIKISTEPNWFIGISFGNVHNNVTIEVPEGMEFGDILMNVGAGELNCSTLSADSLNAEIGAGSIILEGFECKEAELMVGAGEIIVANGIADEMDIDVGMGDFILSGKINKELDLDCGMGNAQLHLEGAKEDYNYEIDCGMGNITVGDSSYGGVATSQEIDNGSNADYDLDCGMGNVEIHFNK